MSYESGWRVTFKQGLTRGQLMDICQALSAALSEAHGTPVQASPEKICEGGIELKFAEHPEWYKTIRFSSGYLNAGYANRKWPYIHEGTLATWVDSPEELFVPGGILGTFIKAFTGAPDWTREQMQCVEAQFKRVGGTVSHRGRKRLFAA